MRTTLGHSRKALGRPPTTRSVAILSELLPLLLLLLSDVQLVWLAEVEHGGNSILFSGKRDVTELELESSEEESDKLEDEFEPSTV